MIARQGKVSLATFKRLYSPKESEKINNQKEKEYNAKQYPTKGNSKAHSILCYYSRYL
jgi:hypothetical protein